MFHQLTSCWRLGSVMALALNGMLWGQDGDGLTQFNPLVLAQARQSVISIESLTLVNGQSVMQVGSGFIIDSRGFAVTRRNLVASAERITVTLHDSHQIRAKVIYDNSETELALLKLEGEGYRAVSLGSIETLSPQSCLTVLGNSIGIFPSVTLALNLGQFPNGLIRLGAVIPPGNSGSPVFDAEGRLVAMLIGRGRGEVSFPGERSLGLALPIEMISMEMDAVIAHLDEHPGWVGLSVTDLASGPGVEVIQVFRGGPAEAGGLCLGDTIIALEGEPFQNARDLETRVTAQDPESLIAFTVKKGPLHVSYTVKVADRRAFPQKQDR